MTPGFSISTGGLDITERFAGKIEIEVVDATGTESDSCEVKLLDPAGMIAPPRRGATLAVSLGYRETGLIPQGLFKVDQVNLLGPPHKIRITANAADNKEALKERRTKDYTNSTFGQIVAEVAGRHGLIPKIASDLARINFPMLAGTDQSYIGQQEESDAGFLTRVAERVGGFMSIKNGFLIVARRGDGKSMSGAIGRVVIRPQMLLGPDSYDVTFKDKPIHGEVEASYFDRDKVAREPVKKGGGDGGVAYRFREPFPSKKQAEDAAAAKQRELARGEISASFSIWGDATIRAEMDAVAEGIRSGVDGVPLTISRVTKNVGERGFTTKIEAENKPKEGSASKKGEES